MDYLKHAKRATFGNEELVFIRCDKNGELIDPAALGGLGITNATISRIVGEAAMRIPAGDAPDGRVESGIVTG